MFAQQLEFDFSFSCPHLEAEYYREGAQDLIRRLVPGDLLEENHFVSAAQRARFADLLPILSWSDLSKAPCTLSVLLLCKYRWNACHFFYDMVSRWLLPQRKVNVELFFASDVRLPHLSDELLSVAEIVIYLKSASDVEEVRRNIGAIETEVRLGVVSNYHARRILEFKGLSSDGKTAMVQEKISSLIQSHSKDFDRGIFTQMQQFLITCKEEFKGGRDYHHISRLISNLYALRKLLQKHVEATPQERHVMTKFFKTRIDNSLSTGGRPVLGILAGLNLCHEHEIFATEHLVAAIHKILPKARIVDNSPFVDPEGKSVQILYLEIEKDTSADFTLDEIHRLRSLLPEELKASVERLTRPLFMPRNEEEVLRNIMTLADELRHASDAPQAILSLDEQRGETLTFTVILVRSALEGAPSLPDLLALHKGSFIIQPDRVRKVGRLRGKAFKEATVFRALVESAPFLRTNHTVDCYKAREVVMKELSSLLGEIRDYNGGMLLRQKELLKALQALLGPLSPSQELFVETFFYALTPMEMRTILDPEPLKQLFLLLAQVKKGGVLQKRKEARWALVAAPRLLPQGISSAGFPSSRFASFQIEGEMLSGALLLSGDEREKERVFSLFS
ncbi:MAG: hypothetical protein KGI80_01545 [Verrucomicrobiota bacterium]|nr:hypothetical protein [Verrucomicrobiota bacterium]